MPEPPLQPREIDPRGLPIGRLAFLGAAAVGVASIAFGAKAGSVVSGVASIVPGDVSAFLPTDGWRIYSVGDIPTFDPATYRLKVTGLVENELDLSWDEVRGLAGVEQVSDFHCVTGWSIKDVPYEGFRPQTIVDLARPLPAATAVRMVSDEKPYEDSLTLEQFLLPDVLVARSMLGAPVTRNHGAPLRVVIPQMYGYKGVKWLGEIRFEDDLASGYWEQRGYDQDAWLGRSNGRNS